MMENLPKPSKTGAKTMLDAESAHTAGTFDEEGSSEDFIDFLEQLGYRDRLLRLLRAYFHASGFLEIQPPCLSRDCVVDAYLDPIGIRSSELGVPETLPPGTAPHASVSQYFLQTSAESTMKRLLARGAPSIFAISPVFRRGEFGPKHNVEFTMLEWYEVGGDAASAISMLGKLATAVFGSGSYETVSYQDAFTRSLGIDPIECDVTELTRLVGDVDSELAISLRDDRDSLLDVLLSHFVEKDLGKSLPTIVTRYPATQAALARACEDDCRVAHRFELFYKGVELANGYDELRDWRELVRRYEINNQIRCRSGRTALPVETTLVEAMRQGLPQCSGVAVGVDRLQMLQTGARCIDEVMPLPIDIA